MDSASPCLIKEASHFLATFLSVPSVSGRQKIVTCREFTELGSVSAGSGVRALGDFGCPQETFLAPAAPPMVGPPGPQAGIHNPVGHSWCEYACIQSPTPLCPQDLT